jgi:hypothetical protein
MYRAGSLNFNGKPVEVVDALYDVSRGEGDAAASYGGKADSSVHSRSYVNFITTQLAGKPGPQCLDEFPHNGWETSKFLDPLRDRVVTTAEQPGHIALTTTT